MLWVIAAAVQTVGRHETLASTQSPVKDIAWSVGGDVAALGSCILSYQPALFLLQSGKDKDAIDKVFKNLDENGDSQVDFKEFVIFVAALTCCCHKYFEQNAAK